MNFGLTLRFAALLYVLDLAASIALTVVYADDFDLQVKDYLFTYQVSSILIAIAVYAFLAARHSLWPHAHAYLAGSLSWACSTAVNAVFLDHIGVHTETGALAYFYSLMVCFFPVPIGVAIGLKIRGQSSNDT